MPDDFLTQASGIGAKLAQDLTLKQPNKNREGTKLLGQAMSYPMQMSHQGIEEARDALQKPANPEDGELRKSQEKMVIAANAMEGLRGHYIVLPDAINAALRLPHATSYGDETAATKAHKIAKLTGHDDLAKAIQEQSGGTHSQGRLTEDQIISAGIDHEFGNPTLYQVRIVNRETRDEGTYNVDLNNFTEVGMAMENMQRHLGMGESIMSATEYAQMRAAENVLNQNTGIKR